MSVNGSFYGVYRSCRDAAWRCQLDFEVCRLPVKVIEIARVAGIRVVRNSSIDELRTGELAVSIFDGRVWTIVYDDRLDTMTVRFVTAHELGHIFLGHEYRVGERRFAFTGQKLALEREADMFAVRLLAPAFALHELGAIDAESISALCQIPLELARERAKRMSLLERRKSYYKSPKEKQLYDKFKAFFEEFGVVCADSTESDQKSD